MWPFISLACLRQRSRALLPSQISFDARFPPSLSRKQFQNLVSSGLEDEREPMLIVSVEIEVGAPCIIDVF